MKYDALKTIEDCGRNSIRPMWEKQITGLDLLEDFETERFRIIDEGEIAPQARIQIGCH